MATEDKNIMMTKIRHLEGQIIIAITENDWTKLPTHADSDTVVCWFTMLKENDYQIEKFISRCKEDAKAWGVPIYLTRETVEVQCDTIKKDLENCIYLIVNDEKKGPLVGLEIRINVLPVEIVAIKYPQTIVFKSLKRNNK